MDCAHVGDEPIRADSPIRSETQRVLIEEPFAYAGRLPIIPVAAGVLNHDVPKRLGPYGEPQNHR